MRKKTNHAALIHSASESDANLLWATRFSAPDPFTFIERNGKKYLLMSDLERDRAKEQAEVDEVWSYSDFAAKLQASGVATPSTAQVLAEVLYSLKIERIEVPANFPLALADQLRALGFQLDTRSDPFWPKREIKTETEVRAIRESLRAAESGIEAGIEAIRRSEMRKDGYLYLEGAKLTSETLKRVINTTIMSQGFVPSHTIVASGDQCVDPHNQGSGPIRSNTSIIMDIFPRSDRTGFFGDITRTVVRGRASDRLKAAYACVLEGQKIAFRRIRDGANASDIHLAIRDYFAAQGFPTGLIKGRMQGFFHGTGHGLGLDIHEAPGLGSRTASVLKAGHVVTVEPGLYYMGMGGVRLEDVVLVKPTGCTNLVRLPKVLEI